MEKVLITGSNGELGRLLTEYLKTKNYEVFGIDMVDCDLSNKGDFELFLQKVPEISTVVHLAANKDLSAPWDSIYKNNIVVTKNLYELADKYGIKKIILASSRHATLNTYYGISKAACELIAKKYYLDNGIHTICLRMGIVSLDNEKTWKARHRSMWLHTDDWLQSIIKSLESKTEFGIYYVFSNNFFNEHSIKSTKKELGYRPKHNSHFKFISMKVDKYIVKKIKNLLSRS